MVWFGQFELLTPVHTTGASSKSNPLQVTLIKPKHEQPSIDYQPVPSRPSRNEEKTPEKSQMLKQVMVAFKNSNNVKVQNSEIIKLIAERTAANKNVPSKSLNQAPTELKNSVIVTNTNKVKYFTITATDSAAQHEAKTLSQQQVARITAHLNQALDQYFSYPRLAQRNGWQGMVKLGLRIEANGQLSNIRVLSTSGFPILDQAALNTLSRISTLQDASIWLDGLHLDTVLPVQYKLVDS